ncbi:MAG: hypothetical protein K5888_02500, partial [Lachnospiraceae bacterium]|nr:hypothetical protein [Lachnospiraceae bacterium]
MSVLIFVACFLFFRYVDVQYPRTNDPAKKRAKVCSIVFGAIFTLFYFLYDRDNYVAELSNRAFRFLMLIAVIAGLFFFFMYVLRFLYIYLADRSRTDAVFYSRECASTGDGEVEKAEPGEGETAKTEPRAGGASKIKLWRKLFLYYEEHMVGCTFALCLIFFLPYFLYQFPGIMTPDSIVQYEQVLHIKPYSNHHPWVHTLMLEFFYDIGYAFTRNPNISASFYTVAQMVFMAWSAS